MRTFGIGAAIALIIAFGTAKAQTLSADDLSATIQRYRAYEPADAFSPPFDESVIIGRPFRIERPLRSGDSTGPAGEAMGFWTYDPRSQALRLVADDRPWLPVKLIHNYTAAHRQVGSIDGFEFTDVRTSRETYVGENSYGATFEVVESHLSAEAVAEFSSTYQDTLPKADGHSYEVTVQRAPEEARRLSMTARVVVEGEVVPFLPGQAIACITDYRAATMSSPSELYVETCLVSAEIARVAIEDSATGTVLAEWR